MAPLGADAKSDAQVIVLAAEDPSKAIYLSYRRNDGIDAGLGAEFHERLSVHEFASSCPGTEGPPPFTILLTTLGAGETYESPGAGFQLKLVAKDADRAEVQLTQ